MLGIKAIRPVTLGGIGHKVVISCDVELKVIISSDVGHKVKMSHDAALKINVKRPCAR